jgi:hypothetical protein
MPAPTACCPTTIPGALITVRLLAPELAVAVVAAKLAFAVVAKISGMIWPPG